MANRNKNKRIAKSSEVPSHANSAKRSGSPPILHLSIDAQLDDNLNIITVETHIKLPFTLSECALKIAEAAFSIADELCYKKGVLLEKTKTLADD